MRSMVVLFAVLAAAAASYVPLAQPPHHPAVVLDPHGRPLDTAEVIAARALHLQAKHLEHAPLAYAAPLSYAAYPAHAPALYSHSLHGYNAPLLHSHLLKKRSLAHLAYSAPLVAHVAPSAVSHQSRVDVVSSPAVVSHAVAAPVLAHAAPYVAHAAPYVAHVAPAAVSHQSRVDVRTSPAVVAHAAVAPVHHYAHAPLHYSSPLLHHAW